MSAAGVLQFTLPGFSLTSYGYVIASAGTYLFSAQATVAGSTGGNDYGVMILKNGSPYQFGAQLLTYNQPSAAVTAQITCIAGDLIQLGAYTEGAYSFGPGASGLPSTSSFSAVFLAN